MRPLLFAVSALLVSILIPDTNGRAAETHVEAASSLTEAALWAHLDALRAPRNATVQMEPPTPDQSRRARAALQLLFAGIQRDDAALISVGAERLAPVGYLAQALTVDAQRFVLVTESRQRGGGGYLFRTGPVASEILVQAPHAYFDLRTFEIAFRTVTRQSVRALYFNTLHRHHNTTAHDGHHRSDVAHAPETWFALFTNTWLEGRSESTVLQIHGFDDPGLRRAGVDIVVSNGTAEPDPITRRLAEILSDTFNAAAALYGESTDRYGATTNVIGRAARERGARFVHIELSAALRTSPRALPLSAPAT